jgi:hypothetical protein
MKMTLWKLREISLCGSQPSSVNDDDEEDAELAEFACQIGADDGDDDDDSHHVVVHSVSIYPLPSTDLQRLPLGSSAPLSDAVQLSDATAGMDEAAESERHNASAQLRRFVDDALNRHISLHQLTAEGRSAAASGSPSVILGQRGPGDESLSLCYTLNWH